MARDNTKSAATDEELNKLFEDIDTSGAPSQPNAKPADSSKTKLDTTKEDEDLLADIENQLAARPTSRPHTPGGKSVPKRGTPPPSTSGRISDDKSSAARKSAESTRSFHTSFKPSADQTIPESQQEPEKAGTAQVSAVEQEATASNGGSWWGGIFATASAAVKTAEAAVKEIQQNEEAKRWAEQVKGNYGTLRGLGGELRSRALPTFTNILETLAPPISSHERLQIHITHDFIGYPSLDSLIYQTFSRVMSQVEGGDLMVIQRGHESSPRRGSDAGYTGSGSAGWHDGPWWRSTTEKRDLGIVKGLTEGTKLVRASAESYANEFFASRGGIEQAAQRATEIISQTNPVRSSDIFLAIQAISYVADDDLFGGPPAVQPADQKVSEPETKPDELIAFAIYLNDPIHSINFHTLSQFVPAQWIRWLDAPSPLASPSPQSPTKMSGGFFSRLSQDGHSYSDTSMPEEIAQIIEEGGVDPREWAAEWVEEAIGLGVGIVAQRYVAKRMGVGEGGFGRGKRREDILEAGGGEVARAV